MLKALLDHSLIISLKIYFLYKLSIIIAHIDCLKNLLIVDYSKDYVYNNSKEYNNKQ